VREEKALDLMTALKKMTLMPAERLQKRAPAFNEKGRIRVGADADITVIDPGTVIDRATYEKPLQYSEGIPFVLVGGVPMVKNGNLVAGVFPRSEEHTSELQSRGHLVCRLLLDKKKNIYKPQ